MAKYTFQDNEPLQFELLQPGVYQIKIVDAVEGIQKGGKTGGSEFINVKVAVGDKNGIRAQWSEKIIFHQDLEWKVDCFLRCINFAGGNLAKGQDLEVTPQTVVGCRGHVKVAVEKYTNGSGEEKEINKVTAWLCDKPAIERDMALVRSKFPEPSQTDPFDDGDAPF